MGDAEIAVIQKKSLEAGAFAAVMSNHWAKGGEGAIELAEAVVAACNAPPQDFKFLYPDDASIKDKLHTIVTEMYGGEGVTYSDLAEEKIKNYTASGLIASQSVLQKLNIHYHVTLMPK